MVPASEASWHGTACIYTGGLAWPVLGGCKQIAAWVWLLAESRYQNRSRSCLGSWSRLWTCQGILSQFISIANSVGAHRPIVGMLGFTLYSNVDECRNLWY